MDDHRREEAQDLYNTIIEIYKLHGRSFEYIGKQTGLGTELVENLITDLNESMAVEMIEMMYAVSKHTKEDKGMNNTLDDFKEMLDE